MVAVILSLASVLALTESSDCNLLTRKNALPSNCKFYQVDKYLKCGTRANLSYIPQMLDNDKSAR